ncbi:MAG TPA: hypothetical protein VE398_03980 [Acidobacteriota bacterium]|nr:hypothetical protein [Acidobacteriota bacterium]
MGSAWLFGRLFRGRRVPVWQLAFVLATALVLGIEPATHARHGAQWEQVQSDHIPAAEFSRIVTEFSEENGFFRSDNFVSNETSYLHVLDKMRDMGCTGGAYIGVGPEQNFTYIAKIRPRVAFIVDIRRQAVIQHLMYKAIFHLADTRAKFLAYLFSIPLSAGVNLPADAPIDRTLNYFEMASSSPIEFSRNLELIEKTIEDDFAFPLSDRDKVSLRYVYTAFHDENLNIQYRAGNPSWPGNPWGSFPTLREIILQEDLRGRPGNFLASRSDYEFIRDLQEHNRIIPVVGDFAGTKALDRVAEYLKRNGYWVSAFYTSNVEQYLFNNGVFNGFAENVARLPITDKSIFIRAFPNMREPHPAKISGHRLTTLLERISVFLKDYDQGLYQDYWSLVTTHYIAADQ